MIKYYFKTAFRNLRSQRISSLVNIIGLTMGITSVIMIMLFVLHEKSYEKFYRNAEHIFRVSPPDNARTAPMLSPLLKKDIPDVLTSVRVFHFSGIVKADDHYFNEDRCFFADPGFLNIFSYDLIEGDRNEALKEPYSIVISQSTARKYFGAQNSLGKILYIQDTIPVRVTGVYKDMPLTTHLKTDMVISFATSKIMGARFDTWDNNIYYTYVLLHNNSTLNSFQLKLNDFVKKNINGLPNREEYKLEAQNICDIHLNSSKAMEIEPNARKSTLQIFISIALLVLLIACINYINISTATASGRRKEIGLRKTIGARGIQIKIQYLSESVLTALISFIIAVALTILFLPAMNSVTGTDLKVRDLFAGGLVFFIIGFVMLVGLLAGIYPAAMLSSFNPIGNLTQRNHAGKQKIYFRQGFVAIQFALSLILVIGTIIIYRQLNFMKKQSLGFDKEHVLILPFNYDAKVAAKYEILKQELLKNPGIKYATESGDIPGKMATTMSFWAEGMPLDKTGTIQTLYVDYDFIPTYDMKILTGRDFSKNITSDKDGGYILNENALTALGWNKENAIGKKLTIQSEGKVIGVVKDFHFNSLEQPVTPLVMSIRPDWSGYISLRVSTHNIDKTVQHIANTWQKNVPGRPLEYYFLEEDFNRLYLAEDRLSSLVTIFTTLSFLIAAIGITGLTIFNIERRTKEIGIRKVVGASARQIAFLFSKEFFKPVLFAMILAFPIAWYVMHLWLRDFAYRINISWEVFVIAGLIAIMIAMLTGTMLSVKAAIANPVKSLRTE